MAIPHSTIGSFGPAFASARLVGLAVNLAYTHTLDVRLPTVLNQASRSSVTLWEETAPVKLPIIHGLFIKNKDEVLKIKRVVFHYCLNITI